MYDLYHKKLDVVVTTTTENEQERQKVAEQLKKQVGDQANLSFVWKVDPSLLSGMKAEVRGSLLLDTTGRKKLEDEATAYLGRLDSELSRLKQEKNLKASGSLDLEQQSKNRWDKLLSDVLRYDLVGEKSVKGKKGVVGEKAETVGAGQEEDTERMRLLTEIYHFKRVNETKAKATQ